MSACTLPPTSLRRVRLIVTDLAVIEPSDAGLGLREVAPDVRLDHGVESTAAELISNDEVPVMPVVTRTRARGAIVGNSLQDSLRGQSCPARRVTTLTARAWLDLTMCQRIAAA